MSNATQRIGRGIAVTGLISACVLLLSPVLRADTILLKNGKTLEGRVTENGETVTIEMTQGSVKVKRSQIQSITPKATPQDELAAQSAALEKEIQNQKMTDAEQADRWFVLAYFAQQKQLTRAYVDLLKKVLTLDSQHAGAREASGFVLLDGRWLTPNDRNAELGMVEHEGKWIPREALQDIAVAKKELRDKAEQVRRDETHQLIKEAELNKLRAERAQLDAERRLMETQRNEIIEQRNSAPSLPYTIYSDYLVAYVPSYSGPYLTQQPQQANPITRPSVKPRPRIPPRKDDPIPSYNNGKSNPGFPFLP